MPKTVPSLQENKKPFHRRNGSGEIHVIESARYFENISNNNTLAHKHYMREGAGRLSLDIPNPRRNSIPLQALMMENRSSTGLRNMVMDQIPVTVIKNNDNKKHKHPSSPGGKLAHFLNSLFNQTSSKKSKSKSKSTASTTHSMKDEDESPSGWRRKRRSSISLFRSGNSNSTMSVSDTKSSYISRTILPQAFTKSSTYRDPRGTYSDHTPASEITKIPLNENHNKNETLMIKSMAPELKRSSGNGLLEKIRVCDVKHDDDHQRNDPTVEIRELKSFILDDYDGGDSDSSSDLFELTNYDLGYYSSGLPVFETTHMDSIKRGAPMISS